MKSPTSKILLVLFVVLGWTACSKSHSTPNIPQIAPAALPADTLRPMLLHPGDDIEIKFTWLPELNQRQMIRADGNIALPYAGVLPAAGLTPSQLQSTLQAEYAKHLRKPELYIILHTFRPQSIFVGGEVQTPGRLAWEPGMNLVGALLAAGGPERTHSRVKEIYVIRQVGSDRYIAVVDLSGLGKGELPPDLKIYPDDIIFVSRSRISRLNQWVDQYINKMIPQGSISASIPVTSNFIVGIGK